MKKIMLSATAAALLATPALSAEALRSTITAIDISKRTVTLSDKTIMIVGKDVDLSTVKPGTKVAITARMDEDGFSPITAITPVQ